MTHFQYSGGNSRHQALKAQYPTVADELSRYNRVTSRLPRTVEEIANDVFVLGQLWLVFLDGDSFGLTEDREIYDEVVRLAASPPRCSIEEEALSWMRMMVLNLTTPEIKLGLECAVKSVGQILVLNGNFDETLEELVKYRDYHNPSPSLRKKYLTGEARLPDLG